ncbi:hypothetical protein GJ744_009572 [Endocarpon pusillum]|uniref:Uncharacterized protein n=1 Tax=Endocarpon pusillum TaxID=364733 RepID=A0A8H7AJF5_9EURO|nr:hypothetical protein GJ744_009572 [Endocarpon pusillum]
MDTPISALPSRFVADNLLPSPSSFYPDWGFGSGAGSGSGRGGSGGHDSNMLPSPLTFPTPVVQVGAPLGWGRAAATSTGLGTESGFAVGEKRKDFTGAGAAGWSDDRAEGETAKKIKT